ncbi:hypothetical protein P691DRAFT_71286 [Macrolepiota fuliginosa MF-IS2]|uniref:NACHT domain-containing protein n=1 Tax=Macrolepiota fuliginosa MF-IS2 TaxID=1400762 RepID=A0A9P6C441_9AGAR|nr:hypothetical protein P691DRAFT_71286 [Macrolepiota fuliginosa MF-IS2]
MPLFRRLKAFIRHIFRWAPQPDREENDGTIGAGSGGAPTTVESASREDAHIITSGADDSPILRRNPLLTEFTHAHNFTINHPTFTEQVQVFDNGRIVASLLLQKGISGAQADSSERAYPPRCHPGTRTELLTKISDWILDRDRDHNMLWILGPAGVGKSAIAQTVAERSMDDSHFGAAFFFSRLNQHDDPSRVIPTLAYQLQARDPGYRQLITQLLADDHTILEKDIRTQFRKLVAEPFRILDDFQPLKKPLLIILDGLDECDGEETQHQFIDLISTQTRSGQTSSLLWMICSRPEPQLKRMLSNTNNPIDCQREEISIEENEDVYTFLRDGFERIRNDYRDLVPDQWPSEAHVQLLARWSSGLFILASTMLKVIGDEAYSNPISQLDVCLKFVGGSSIPTPMNPLHSLDLLYKQILAHVPVGSLPVLKRILCLAALLCETTTKVSILVMLDVLGLDIPSFYRAVREVYSIIDVPTSEQVETEGIHFYHLSFRDFLMDPSRSGIFCITSGYDSVVASVRQYNEIKPSQAIQITTAIFPDTTAHKPEGMNFAT